MALFRNGRFEDDEWRRISPEDEIAGDAPLLFERADFLARREAVLARNAPVGLKLAAGEDLSGLEADLPRFSLIVLDVSKYSDGRLYSVARLLRERWRWSGELRASGDILRDQIAFLFRSGVESFEIAHEGTIAALREGAIAVVRRHYQTASREAEEARVPGLPHARISPRGQIPGDGKGDSQ